MPDGALNGINWVINLDLDSCGFRVTVIGPKSHPEDGYQFPLGRVTFVANWKT